MFEMKKAIIVSNILDPLSRNVEDLKEVYPRLFESGRYDAIENRPVRGEELIPFFNEIRPAEVTTTYYITGDLARAGLSLSGTDEANRRQAVEICKKELLAADKTNCTYLGIGSGAIEENTLKNLDQFVRSLSEIFDFMREKGLKTRLSIEPLDQYAHKKNVIGSLDMTLRLLRKLEKRGYGTAEFILTWDAAHVALNEDDFEESIRKLAKYIYKVHFANAVLDKEDALYGDRHLNFEKGFMNQEVARNILAYCKNYIDHPIEVACEIRETEREHCWILEEETYRFLKKVMEE